MDVKLDYVPNSKQLEFHLAPHKYRLLLGAAGSGKTVALCIEMIETAMQYPGMTGVIFRHAYPQLRDTTKRTFFEVCPDALIKNEVKSEGREEVELVNGSRILFRCLDDYRKLGSTAFDAIGVDEAIEVEEREFLVLIARLRGKVGPRRLMLATNPPDEDHFLYDWFVNQATDDKIVIHSATNDNRANLPEDYIKQLEQYPPLWKEKFYYGNWGAMIDGKPVFPEWDPEKHVDTLFPIAMRPIVRGWDFGFRSPACVWIQRTPTDHIHVLAELVGNNIELADFAKRVCEQSAQLFPRMQFEDYCDVAGTQKNDRGPTAVQVLRNEFGIVPNSRRLGVHQCIERVSYLLRTTANGVPLLQVHERCRWVKKALAGGYHWDKKKDEPVKGEVYDDVFDALKYAVVPLTHDMGASAVPFAGQPFPNRWRIAV